LGILYPRWRGSINSNRACGGRRGNGAAAARIGARISSAARRHIDVWLAAQRHQSVSAAATSQNGTAHRQRVVIASHHAAASCMAASISQ